MDSLRRSARRLGDAVGAFREKFLRDTRVRGHAPSCILGAE